MACTAQEISLLGGGTKHFMADQFNQYPGLDVGLRLIIHPGRASLSLGAMHTTRSYTARSTFPDLVTTSTDVTLRTFMPQVLFGYRCAPLDDRKGFFTSLLGLDILVPYRAAFTRHFADGTEVETDPAPVDFITGIGARTGLCYARRISDKVRLSLEVQGAYKAVLEYVDGADKFNSSGVYNLTDDRASLSLLIGLSFTLGEPNLDPPSADT